MIFIFFKQLCTIHGIIGKSENIKSIPFLFSYQWNGRTFIKIYELLFDKAINLSSGIGYVLNPKFVLIGFISVTKLIFTVEITFPFTVKEWFFQFVQICIS